ncbi:MAG: nucleotide pyrophosphohydrolase [Longimicrobiaceae bacterium]
MTLGEAQRRVDAYLGQFEQGYFPPLANLARLSEEVGELAREINHLHGPKPKRDDQWGEGVAGELGDTLFVLLVLANQLGVELEKALDDTISKYDSRDRERWARK